MKQLAALCMILLIVAQPIAMAQPGLYSYSPFNKGEKATYKVKYDLYLNIPVGEVNFSIKEEAKELDGKNYTHLRAVGRTYGFYDAFFKVRDYYDSYIDPETFQPKFFYRQINEGKYSFNESILFDHEKKKAISDKKEYEIQQNTFDVLSAIYISRTADVSGLQVNDTLDFSVFLERKLFPVGLIYKGKETVKCKKGKFRCLKFKPILIVGDVFADTDGMTLWVTDDKNHLPVLIESAISVGSIKAELTDFRNLKYPLDSKK